MRREFGAPYKFKDRNVADAKDGCIDCTSFDDRTFDLKKIELDKSIQVTVCLYSGIQTHFASYCILYMYFMDNVDINFCLLS